MTKFVVGKSLGETDLLWRYMSLDKFIDLVDSSSLYFAPLSKYKNTDPFEGYMPQVAMNAMAGIPRKFLTEMAPMMEKLASSGVAWDSSKFQQLKESISSHMSVMAGLHRNIAECTTINCWYRNAHESEAMWNLYSKAGVAIRTSVAAMREAFAVSEQDHTINIGAVKYLDFEDPTLTPPDCVTEDGHLIGMIKRIAYEHEREVRLMVVGKRSPNSTAIHEPEPIRIPVDVERLIDAVVISPFAPPTIETSVRAVCRWSELSEKKVAKSPLLANCDYLFDGYK